jgi:hypothetical protein
MENVCHRANEDLQCGGYGTRVLFENWSLERSRQKYIGNGPSQPKFLIVRDTKTLIGDRP